MKYYDKNNTGKVYREIVSEELEQGNSLYVFPYIQMINGNIFKRDDELKVFSDKENKTKYFPDINDLSNLIDQERTVLNVSILELDMHGNPKEKEDMEWFYNGRQSPDEVRIVVNDCYYCGDNVIVNEKLEKRFNTVREIVPEKEKIGIYEISTLPSERISGNSSPAEFQAIVDWTSSLDEYNSNGALIIPEHFTALDEGKVAIEVN